ncbi:MAG: hypothetical protein KKD13_00845, partial [Candidatus Margulisbacteria bacterium]|nr:hypothetical protein [Candidatus Margulisiibacteriota bacterium]
ALLGIRHEGVMGISRNACQAILWKLFSLEKYFGIAVETITRVTVIGDQALIDEKTEVGDNYWLRLSTGQLNKWVEERRMATPFFQFYNDCPPSGD